MVDTFAGVTYYARPALEWDDDSGTQVIQFPLIQYSVEISQEWHGKVLVSLDRSYRETYHYGHEYVISINASFVAEADYSTMFQPFLNYALERREFKFYPHYDWQNRPAHMPAFFTNCILEPDAKHIMRRSEGAAGRWDFAITFATGHAA